MNDSISAEESVVEIDLGVTWSGGAPWPILLQSDHRTFLAFFLSDAHPRTGLIGIIEWLGCQGAVLGAPNDEGRERHRLFDRGLSAVTWAGRVLNSAWVRAVDTGPGPDPRLVGRDSPYLMPLEHYILLFKDSTFECLAHGYSIQKSADPLRAVLKRLLPELPP